MAGWPGTSDFIFKITWAPSVVCYGCNCSVLTFNFAWFPSSTSTHFQGLSHFDLDYDRRETFWYSTVKEAIVRGNSSRNEIIHKGWW